MENQDKYWTDYTEFIKVAETFTGLSPADLIDKYQILIDELEINEYLEWIYENTEDEFTITKVHKLLNQESLKDNILKDEFEEKIKELDSRMKRFLIPSIANDENWWIEFKEDIAIVFEALKRLLDPLQSKRRMIGFNRKDNE